MQKPILFLLIFSLNLCFAQTEKDAYEIYSEIINGLVQDWFDPPIEGIVLVEQYNEKYKQDFSFINELTFDTIPSAALNWYVRDSIEYRRFTTDKNIKGVLADLFSDFKNHPKIQSDLLNTPNIKITTLTSKKYYSYINRGKKWNKNGFIKLSGKYNAKFAIQFSTIKYRENYASFYYEYLCGGLCAAGSVVLIEKIEGEWIVFKEFNLWES